MSYDVSIGDRHLNYTSNVAALFYDHIPKNDSAGGLHELHGKTGKQAADIISGAWARIEIAMMSMWELEDVGETKFCAQYDAPNGWGSTVGGMIFLAQIMSACIANPRKKVSVSA